MNKGINLARGEWFYFLGADDYLADKDVLHTVFSENLTNSIKLIVGNIKYNLKKKDKTYTHKKNGLVIADWSFLLWIKNIAHHQAVFYRKELFNNNQYVSKYNILGDHYLNIKLYKTGVKAIKINTTIAHCATEGKSKNYTWQLYKEEINLKTELSSLVFKPIFYIIGLLKYLFKKIS